MKNRLLVALAPAIVSGMLTGCWKEPTRPNYDPPTNYRTEPAANRTNADREMNTNKTNNANSAETEKTKTGFKANLPDGFEQPADDVGTKLLREYGAVFLARGGVTPPKKVVFRNESEVAAFQSTLKTRREMIGSFSMELQAAAMDGLQNAVKAAAAAGQKITPRGADSAKRTYSETVGLWNSRVDPALQHWTAKGKISQADADRIKAMATFDQVTEVLKLEEKGIFFAKDLSKSIIYSVAPPGTSQHLSLLAFDCEQHDNAAIRSIMAENGWFQTVASDLPHFTFLGVKESELPGLGLKKLSSGGRTFWVPDI